MERTDGLAGERQRPALATLGACEIGTPDPAATALLLAPFRRLSVAKGPPGLRAVLLAPDGTPAREVDWRV